MALYHFTWKNDKKPSSKTQIKAVEHASYIAREGKYKNQDDLDKTQMDNVITALDDSMDVLKGETVLLYRSPYGEITHSETGFAIEDNPSLDTIAIGLMVADKTLNHAPLVVNGSELFRAKCVVAAASARLPIQFQDDKLQQLFIKKKEDFYHERRDYREKGGKFIKPGTDIQQSDFESNGTGLSTLTTINSNDMFRLPQFHVGQDERQVRQGDSSELLLRDEDEELQLRASSRSNNSLRRGIYDTNCGRIRDYERGRRTRAERTARTIIANINENKEYVKAQSHVEYINREKAFEQKGGCVYKENKLPQWAKDSATSFFKAADRYSNRGARRYYEAEFALQNELTLEQNLEIVHRFIEENLADHYYAFAIHDKIGSMSDGTHNLHVHLMVSPRIIDDIEKKKERKRSHYFSYPLRENVKNPTEEARRTHGAPVDRRFSGSKFFIQQMRESYCDITNETLEKYNKKVRIDHRSLKEQAKIARMNGDDFLANILDRIPEEHISRMGILETKNPRVQKVLAYRKEKNAMQDLAFEAEMLRISMLEDERKEIANALTDDIQAIVESNEYLDSDNDSESLIGNLRESFVDALDTYDRLRQHVISSDDAKELAELEYMTMPEREIYQEHKQLVEDIAHWNTFRENLSTPITDDKDELDAYESLLPALDERMDAMLAREEFLRKKMEERVIPTETKSQIQKLTNQILQENKHRRNDLKVAESTLRTAMDALKQALFQETEDEKSMDSYSTRELYDILRKRYYGYKKEKERLTSQVADAKKKVISMKRAQKMAEDLYVGGAFKQLREERREYKKQESRLASAWEKYNQQEENIKQLQSLAGSDRDLLQEVSEKKRALALSYDELIKKNSELDAWKKRLDDGEEKLMTRISASQAVEKIKAIALGIVRKNAPYKSRYEVLNAKLKYATDQKNKSGKQLQVVKDLVKKDPKNQMAYRVEKGKIPEDKTPLAPNPNDQPGIIAEALLGNGQYTPVVARSRDDDDKGMHKNWTLLSELAKEEEMSKNLYRMV